MTDRPDHAAPRDAEIDRYVDGLMTDAEAKAFEQRLQADEALRDEAQSMRAIDDSLRRSFGDWRTSSPKVAIHRPEPARRLFTPLRVAACIGLIILATAALWTLQRDRYVDAAPLYHAQVDAGFQPSWVCDTDYEFARWTNNRLRQALTPAADAPDGFVSLGWSFVQSNNPLGANAAIMLGQQGEDRIVLLVDRIEHDRPVGVASSSGLRTFRRELGSLVMYEITPLDSPVAIQSVTIAPSDIFDSPPTSTDG